MAGEVLIRRAARAVAALVLTAAAAQTASGVDKTVTATVEWTLPGTTERSLHWGPWYVPSGSGAFARTRFGLRVQERPNVDLRMPVKVKFEWDPNKAMPGGTFPVQVTVATEASTGTTQNFHSEFGLFLPNELQFGLGGGIGPATLGLVWYDAPFNFWSIADNIPGDLKTSVGGVPIAALVTTAGNVNIEMKKQAPLPITGLLQISDEESRARIKITLATLLAGQKNSIVKSVHGKMGSAGNALKNLLGEQALKYLIGELLDELAGLLRIFEVNANPSFKLEGHGLDVWVTARVGQETNRFLLKFGNPLEASGSRVTSATQTLNIYLPPYLPDANQITLGLERVGYTFRVQVGVSPFVQIATWRKDFASWWKAIAFETAEHAATAAESSAWSVAIPLKTPPNLYAFRVQAGAKAATIRWVTPNFPTKGQVLLYISETASNAIQTKSENTPKYTHFLGFTGLNANTKYHYVVRC